jgi:hypothetical protein
VLSRTEPISGIFGVDNSDLSLRSGKSQNLQLPNLGRIVAPERIHQQTASFHEIRGIDPAVLSAPKNQGIDHLQKMQVRMHLQSRSIVGVGK